MIKIVSIAMKSDKNLAAVSAILAVLTLSIMVSCWATKHAISGGERLPGNVRSGILLVANLPSHIKSLFEVFGPASKPKGVENSYLNYSVVANSSNTIDGCILISSITSAGLNRLSLLNISNRVETDLITISNDLYKNPDANSYTDSLICSESRRQPAFSSYNRVWNPVLAKDGSLIYCIPWNDLISINPKSGKINWRIRGAFHHSIEFDHEGKLWVCGAIDPGCVSDLGTPNIKGSYEFEDQALVQVSTDGVILKVISVADLLSDNGLEHLMYGVSSPKTNLDPIHLNQITPVLKDSGSLRKGQLIISLRNLSTVILLDPVRKFINWYQTGPWMNQHCSIHVGPSTISVLDNHSIMHVGYWLKPNWFTKIISCNIDDGKIEEVSLFEDAPTKLRIPIEGRALNIGFNRWLIEDSWNGTILLFENKKLILKWLNLYPDGTVGRISWCRYIPPTEIN
jgi:hypothetical protein